MSGLTGIKVIMARVTFIRHGKAETSKLGVQDFDRPLISRGQINASAVGAFLATHRMLPQLVLVSPSARTRETYDFIKPHWPIDIKVQFVDQLYEASASTLLQAIIDYGGNLSDIAVIGHNPSLVVLLNHMVDDAHAEQNLGYFPTCCTADVGFVAPKVCDLASDEGRLLSIKRARDL